METIDDNIMFVGPHVKNTDFFFEKSIRGLRTLGVSSTTCILCVAVWSKNHQNAICTRVTIHNNR